MGSGPRGGWRPAGPAEMPGEGVPGFGVHQHGPWQIGPQVCPRIVTLEYDMFSIAIIFAILQGHHRSIAEL